MVKALNEVFEMMVSKKVFVNVKCGFKIALLIENFGFTEFENSIECGNDDEFEEHNYPIRISKNLIENVEFYDVEDDFIHIVICFNSGHSMELIYE